MTHETNFLRDNEKKVVPALPISDFIKFQNKIFSIQKKLPIYYKFKIILETLLATLLLTLLSPFLGMVAILIKTLKGGKVFHKQKRVGKNGTIFYVYKFRTLKTGSPKVIEMGFTPLKKLENDPRVEGELGRFLRKWKIDEIPQLINVVKGDMLLLGPRPYIIEENLHMTESHVERFAVRPGMSGYWQALKTNLNDPDEKATLDCKYVRDLSLSLDLKIWINTFKVVFVGENFSESTSSETEITKKSKTIQKRAS